MQIIAYNFNRYFGTSDYKVGTVEPTDVKLIEFAINTKVYNALASIAETFECEWYISGRTINLVHKLSEGAEVDFENEVSVSGMESSSGTDEDRITRLLALGSDRNIPAE